MNFLLWVSASLAGRSLCRAFLHAELMRGRYCYILENRVENMLNLIGCVVNDIHGLASCCRLCSSVATTTD